MAEKKDNKYKELFKNTGVLAIGSFSSKVLVFLLVPLYTSILTTGEYGFYDLVYTTIQLLVPILTLDVTDSVLRFTMDEAYDNNKLVRIDLKYLSIGTVIFAFSLLFLVFLKTNSNVTEYWLFILLYYIFYMINQYLNQFAKGIDRVKDIAISGVISTVVTVVLCALLLIVFPLGLDGFFISYIAGQAISVLYLAFRTKISRFISKGHTNKCIEKEVIKYSAPLILNNIGWWMNNTSDKYVITFMSGVEANGLLSVAYKIPSILSVFVQLFTQAWQIAAIKEYKEEKDNKFYNNVFKCMNCCLFFATIILIALTKWIAGFLFQGDFFSAWIFVPFLIISSVFTASSGFMAAILSASYNTKPVAISTVVGGVTNVILNFALIYIMGNIGVTVATAISSFLIFYIRYYYIRNLFDKKVLAVVLIQCGLLTLQSILAIKELYIYEVVFIILSFIAFRKDLMNITRQVIATFKK